VRADRLRRSCCWCRPAAGFEVSPAAAPTPLTIARTLVARGATVQVEDPPEARAELVRLGRELVTVDGA
jgi:hypothetical protein